MRYLLAFLLMLPVLAWGQSSLPPCTAAETDWRAQRHNCFGTYTWPDGRKYVGEWRDDKRSGQGTWTHPNGEKYVGEYQDDKRHGQGIWYRADGSIALSGRWENSQFVQRLALDTNRFPFNAPVTDPGKAERDRLTAEAELKRQQEIDRRLAAAVHEWERANRFPFNAPVADAGKAERDRLAAELEGERRKRAEAEARQLAETRERERLAAEAKERDRLVFEAERRRQQELEQKLAAETRERERLAAEAEAERKKRQELEEKLASAERPPIPAPQASKPQASLKTERRVALVIGNSTYKVNPQTTR